MHDALQFYIGISGGHHKSTAVLIHNRTVVACASGESLNPHALHPDEVAGRLSALLARAGQQIGIESAPRLKEQTRRLVIALPGAATNYDQKLGELALLYSGWSDSARFQVVDDTWAGLIAASTDGRGICAFAGTGASVFVGLGQSLRSHEGKFDGWGPLLGDFGSGFQLAVDFFRYLCRENDIGRCPPLASALLRDYPAITAIERIQPWFDSMCRGPHNDWRPRFAALTRVVTDAADREPGAYPDAVTLVTTAAIQMADTVKIAMRRYSPHTQKLDIFFHGGMFEHSALYKRTVSDEIRFEYPNKTTMSIFRPVVGAGLIAIAGHNLITPIEDRGRITDSIKNLQSDQIDLLVYNLPLKEAS